MALVFMKFSADALVRAYAFIVETLMYYGKNENYGESAVTQNFVWHWKNASVFWVVQIWSLNRMFAQSGSWVRVG